MSATPIEIIPFGLPLPEEVATWLSERHNPNSAWDLSLNREDHGRLLALDVTRTVRVGLGWFARRGQEVLGVAALEPLAWDTAHFGLPMHRLTHLIVGDRSGDAGHGLLSEVTATAKRMSIGHIQITLDAERAHASSGPEGVGTGLTMLQAHGFRVQWSALRVVRHITSTDRDAVVPSNVHFEQATAAHLTELIEVTKHLAPYNWLELDPALPLAKRRTYVQARLRGCIETDFADLCLVACHRGRALGFNASKFMAHHAQVTSETRWSYERDTFVASEAPPGLGSLMVRAVVDRLSPPIRYIRGRIRINGVAMLRVVRQARYDVEGGDFLLTWANEKQA